MHWEKHSVVVCLKGKASCKVQSYGEVVVCFKDGYSAKGSLMVKL